jgi:TonB family protein
MPDWKSCEGQLFGGKYPLDRLLGGDDESALFLTGPFAIRIRRVAPEQAAEVVGRWNRVKRFPHPHLIRIEEAGASELAGDPVAYLVMERAHENLADVLFDRPLQPDEARAMLLPVATALDYLHRRGMAHGNLKPSHIFALDDTVRISSESVAEGDPAPDIRALGETLIDALDPRTGAPHGAADLPSPFNLIAAGCLDPDPARRWTADKIVSRLRPSESAATTPAAAVPIVTPSRTRFPLRRAIGPAAVAAIVVGIVAGVMLRRTDAPPAAEPVPRPAPAAVAPRPAPVETAAAAPKPAPPPRVDTSRDRLVMEDGVALRVMPAVPEQARKTITGKPVVAVRVTVDSAGNVTDAAVERSFSPYFTKLALDAARKWKFAPEEGAGARHWTLRFQFTSSNTQVVARRAAVQ